ncbi:MAG TPA: pyridoxamine 5'-phosphate oxidase family protein [Acidimicrobiales bacterium]|nr:pyridoxamine 5'-phosphate oxidase family protein [Acidimicrobiales bacterium]
MTADVTPTASRPDIPGYGIVPADAGEGLLPWSWAEERLSASHGYWLGTTRPDGRPHVTPVWAVWTDGAVWFSTNGAVKMANLAAERRCSLTIESTIEAVIVEGTASPVAPHPAAATHAYRHKYGITPPEESVLYRVQPTVVLGFIDDMERFATTATRWTF